MQQTTTKQNTFGTLVLEQVWSRLGKNYRYPCNEYYQLAYPLREFLSDYYPFGSSLPTRSWSDASRAYRFGFNGKEKDNETANDDYDFGARIYDGRLGRWLSVDRKFKYYSELSSYCFAGNNPIYNIDLDGYAIVPSSNFCLKYELIFDKIYNNVLIMKYSLERTIILDANPVVNKNGDKNTDIRATTYSSSKISFNTNYFNSFADKTIFARTLIHELMHAYLFSEIDKLKTKKGWKKNSSNSALFKYVQKFGEEDKKDEKGNIIGRDWQHNYMADFMREDIKLTMQNLDQGENGEYKIDRSGVIKVDNVDVSYTKEQWYDALSFAGLEMTEAWNSLSEETKKLYSSLISIEMNLAKAKNFIFKSKKSKQADSTIKSD